MLNPMDKQFCNLDADGNLIYLTGLITGAGTNEGVTEAETINGQTKYNRVWFTVSGGEDDVSYNGGDQCIHVLCKEGRVQGASSGCLAAITAARRVGAKVPKELEEFLLHPKGKKQLDRSIVIADRMFSEASDVWQDMVIGKTVTFIPGTNEKGFPTAYGVKWGGGSTGHKPVEGSAELMAELGVVFPKAANKQVGVVDTAGEPVTAETATDMPF